MYLRDNLYRQVFIFDHFRPLEKNDVDDFLFVFCAHHKIEKLRKQITPVFIDSNFDFKNMSYRDKFLKLCDIFSKDIRKEFKVFSKSDRAINIKNINDKQIKNIRDSFITNEFISNLFEKDKNGNDKFNLSGRNLVMYFRRRLNSQKEVDYLEFSIMYYILDWYINSGFSRVFDKLSVVSRDDSEYPEFMNDLFPNFVKIKTFNRKMGNNDLTQFVYSCSIGTNIIHFADGDFKELFKMSSIPIVSESIKHRKQESSIEEFDEKNSVIMKGIFYDTNNLDVIDLKPKGFEKLYKRDKNTGDFYGLMKTILRAVVELEERLIREAD